MADPSEVGDTIAASSEAPADTVKVRASRSPRSEAPPDYANLTIVDPAHYAIASEIARGGMGRISIARDLRLGRDVALKEVLDDSGDMQRRFEREVRITARLQHPSIVSVHEAGRWPTGEPFYAMKLVSGKSLDTIVDAASTLAGRLAALPSILAIADAMAYAHRERVIHRDLKPQNVIVGDFGETVVIDWGLAKQLDAPDLFTSGARVPVDPGSNPGQTSAGEILGTLGYMPPEQAGGETVDERADVYAIGAILYHLLAGRPPFTGFNFGELFMKVREGTPEPIASIEPDAPADLIAIVEHAMARDRDARYPTAKELADDLRRFQTGQLVGAHRYSLRELLFRWARRHAPVLAAATVAIIVIAVGGVLAVNRIMGEHAEALDQRALANKNRGDAEQLMEVMLYDLRRRLVDLGRLDLLDTAARKAAAYYDGHHGGDTDDDRINEATARQQIGSVLVHKGARDQLVDQLAKARRLAETVPATSPAYPRALRALAEIARSAGRDAEMTGNTAAAMTAYREEEALAGRCLALVPDDPGALIAKASSESDIAGVLDTRGDRAGALAAEQQALAIAKRVPVRGLDPDLDLVKLPSLAHIGHLLYDDNKVDAALDKYREALQLGLAEMHADETSLLWQWHVSDSYEEIGKALRTQKDYAGALAQFHLALAIDERLIVIEPSNLKYRGMLAAGHESVGDTLVLLGDDAGAFAEIHAAYEASVHLVDHDPTNREAQRDLSVLEAKVAEMQAKHGDVVSAIASYRSVVAIRERLIKLDPTNLTWQRDLWYAHLFLSRAVGKLGAIQWRADEIEAAFPIAQALAAKQPDDDTAQFDLSQSYAARAESYIDRRDIPHARTALENTLEIAKRMAARPHPWAMWARLLAFTQKNLDSMAKLKL